MPADVFADDDFGVAFGVHVGGIEEVPAALDEAIHDALRSFDIGAPTPVQAECHGSKAERTDAQPGTAEGDVVIERHGILLVVCERIGLLNARVTASNSRVATRPR